MLEVITDIWGRDLWYIIHYLANLFDTNIIDDYYNFYHSLKYLIPCPVCKQHYLKLINESSIIDFNNKKECIDWAFNTHNIVNKRLGNNVYYKEITSYYNSEDIFHKYLYGISIIFMDHDDKCFAKLKYFYKLICLTNNKFDNIYKNIPLIFIKNEQTFKWINDFNKLLF